MIAAWSRCLPARVWEDARLQRCDMSALLACRRECVEGHDCGTVSVPASAGVWRMHDRGMAAAAALRYTGAAAHLRCQQKLHKNASA